MIKHPRAIPSPRSRRRRILELLDRDGECAIEPLMREFGVSGMTVRRDLRDLEASGSIIRTHGGAAPSGRVAFDFSFSHHKASQSPRKEQIAHFARSLVKPGQHVLLDSSTTTLAIARQLKTLSEITVITTSLPIAAELFGHDNVEVILLGGQLRKNAPDLSGPITEKALGLLRGHIAFIGCDAVDQQGAASTDSVQIARMLSLMADAAERRYIVADHTKMGRQALMQFADLRQWSGLITDDRADADFVAALRELGVRVLTPSRKKG